MLLKELKIFRNAEILRSIPFKLGINLILDKKIDGSKGSGNNVGKTTTLRALDFCLGAKQEVFYKDSEFKDNNSDVISFFERNDIKFELTIESKSGQEILIERSIKTQGKPILRIDNEDFGSIESFNNQLKNLLFMSTSIKPTFRQLMSRTIRNTPEKMSNTLKTLHQITSNADYESVNLFLLGFDDPSLISKKQEGVKELKKHKKTLTILRKTVSKVALEQSISIVEKDINKKETQIKSFKLNESYNEELESISRLKGEISGKSIEITKNEARLVTHDRAIESFEEKIDDTNPDDLKMLYDEAKLRIPDLNKTFTDALNFHNQMVKKKVDFMRKGVSGFKDKKVELNKELHELLALQQKKLELISNTGSLDDYYLMNSQLNSLHERKGQAMKALSLITDGEEKVGLTETSLNKVSIRINEHIDSFKRKLATFNDYFSEFTEKLYGEEFVLFYVDNNGIFDFKVDSREAILSSKSKGNSGEGKKKAQVIALDFANLLFLDHYKTTAPRFVAHDGIESIHRNQIETIFGIAENFENGQYILSILSEKLSDFSDAFIEENTVLELSQENKFFKF